MNDKNIIVNKPEPKPGILERGDLFAIAVGMVIGSGMVTLIGPQWLIPVILYGLLI